MMSIQEKLFLYLCLSFATFKTVYSINCYQCSGTDSNDPFQCNEFLENDVDLLPIDCATIHNAQYCIKHVGRYEGLALECYQCNSSSSMECGDRLMTLDGGILKPSSCEHVYNAQYCIKLTGFLCDVEGNIAYHLLPYNIYYSNIDAPGEFEFYSTGHLRFTNLVFDCIFGGISTKRYCSSLDLGNYCNYVQQPGDKLEYRTCIFTCNTDGCNAATCIKTSVLSLVLLFIIKCFVL